MFEKMNSLMRSLLVPFFLFLQLASIAQSFQDSSVEISGITDSTLIAPHCQFYVDTKENVTPDSLQGIKWKSLEVHERKSFVPVAWLTHPVYLKFTLHNSSDSTVPFYFIAGNYIRSNKFYRLDASSGISPLEDKTVGDGFQPFALKAGEKQTYIAEIYFTKRRFNYLTPQVILESYLPKYKKFFYYTVDAQRPVGFVLSGVLLMMIFFTAANFLISKKKEFLYSCLYSFCMFCLIFLTTFLDRKSGVFTSLFKEFLDFMFLAIGTVFYIAFTRKFLDTKNNYKLLNKIFLLEEKFILLILAAFTFIVFVIDDFQLQEFVENLMKIIVLLIGIVYIVIALGKKNRLMNYLAVGNAILIFFSIISFILILSPSNGGGIFTSSMLYYEVGIVSELISFLLGLTYKNRIELVEKTREQEALKREAEKQNFESKLAVINAQQEERNRISADMHDDLGAGVTAIRLYSELAKKKIEQGSIPEIEKISSSANELLNSMNAIIWTMSSQNDTLDNMVAYIRSYSMEYFEGTGVDCHTHVDEDLPNIPVTGDIRRNIFLVVKEALNNILKHAKATNVSISLKRVPNGLSLYIQDNGQGIDLGNLRRFGNGLNNMRRRMEERYISFNIENNNGTLITLHYKLDL